jgi:hypothetical protein
VSRESILWVKFNELNKILKLVIWIYALDEVKVHFDLFLGRIKNMFEVQLLRRRNNRFVFTYLKECYTLLVSVIYSKTNYVPKVRISVDKSGLPRIIPAPLRQLARKNQNVLFGIFSILGLHRIIKYEPKVDISTITKPFLGLSKTVAMSKLLVAKGNLLKLAGFSPSKASNFSLKVGRIKGLIIEKAGPNGPSAFRRILIDAFALYQDFNLLVTLSKWYIRYGGKRYLLSLYLILLIGSPVYIITGLYQYLNLGRLGVVYNVSGKARVVAMTNWWIQIALHPLHKAIFDLLAKLPTDGTFDQSAPIQRLVSKGLKEQFYSLDLSAATDRLPIELQVQILSMFIGEEAATWWKTLLSVPYLHTDNRRNSTVRYAVGQPMGAYSSWAMLALTHHLIVLMSSSPTHPFDSYAVLGDDVVIQDSLVAREYLSLMTHLGVEISLPKSMVSYDHCEFAKKIFTREGDIVSMISPGLLLATARNSYLVGLLVAEAFARKIFGTKDFLKVIQSSPLKGTSISFGLWSLVGLRGLVTNNQLAALKWGVSWLANATILPETAVRQRFDSLFAYPLKEAVLKLFDLKVETAKASNMSALKTWYQWLSPTRYNLFSADLLKYLGVLSYRYKIVNLLWYPIALAINLLMAAMVIVSPMPWLILDDILIALGDVPNERIRRGQYSLENAAKIASEIRELNVSLIGNVAVQADVEQFVKAYKDLSKYFTYYQIQMIQDDVILNRLLLKPDGSYKDLYFVAQITDKPKSIIT